MGERPAEPVRPVLRWGIQQNAPNVRTRGTPWGTLPRRDLRVFVLRVVVSTCEAEAAKTTMKLLRSIRVHSFNVMRHPAVATAAGLLLSSSYGWAAENAALAPAQPAATEDAVASFPEQSNQTPPIAGAASKNDAVATPIADARARFCPARSGCATQPNHG